MTWRDHLEHVRLWLLAVVVAPAWQWLQVHWGGFWWSSPVVWICLFWAADWVLGSARALHDGWTHPDDPTRGWRARRAAGSVGKLMAWLAVLGVAWGMRDSHMLGGVMAAACLEAGVLLAEVSSVLYHLGEITGSPVLRFYATKFRHRAAGEKETQNAKIPE